MHIFSIYNSLLSIVWGNWKPQSPTRRNSFQSNAKLQESQHLFFTCDSSNNVADKAAGE